jgi:hypothetical protein
MAAGTACANSDRLVDSYYCCCNVFARHGDYHKQRVGGITPGTWHCAISGQSKRQACILKISSMGLRFASYLSWIVLSAYFITYSSTCTILI